MKRYEFGMTALPFNGTADKDFSVYDAQLGGDYNPYNKAFFDKPENMVACNDDGRITSIPSPYARMHITDLAFRESNCGVGVVARRAHDNIQLSADYRRAMSHCLDMFELIYVSDTLDLKEKGISLHKLNLVSTRSQDPKVRGTLYDVDGKLTNLGRYIETLDLFRDEYRRVIREKGVEGYHFDFTSLYIFKYNGKTFASTSPFTGFCTKSDCDLADACIEIGGRRILSAAPATWRTLGQRSLEFRKFLYLLLRDNGLNMIFVNLFEAVRNSFEQEQLQRLNNLNFNDVAEYRKFNVNNAQLQRVNTDNLLYIRPEGLDCSYIKYLLYLQEPVDLSMSEEDYAVDLNERRFPSIDGPLTPWMGANDILSDALFVLTYDINDNYAVVPYIDANDGSTKCRCLLPIKREALNYFTLDDLMNNMAIEQKSQNRYVIKLTVNLKDGGSVVLRREYHTAEAKFPNGNVVCRDKMKPFAFGVYPFVKSTHNKNIHKVLFYNSLEQNYSIDFYTRGRDGGVARYLETEHDVNRTNDIRTNADELPVNCEYHHLENVTGLEFAELTVDGVGTSLIVPKMKSPQYMPGTSATVAIDLGTSNTYMAYTVNFDGQEDAEVDPKEICTNHGSWNELMFMNKRCEREDDANAPEKNRDDLYLRVSDAPGTRPSDEWLDSQLCEFIPSRIDPGLGDESYRFPIPSVINVLRKNAQRTEMNYNQHLKPLIDSAIPFAYYERGKRISRQDGYFDRIQDGSKFKWFYKKNDDGDWIRNDFNSACFNAFVSELLFIVRSHLVCQGYNLSKTKILWSYPLSFAPALVDEYKRTWRRAYKEIINPEVSDRNVDDFVKYTNESRSPIFECQRDSSTFDHLVLLMDIGGGSTDVIGYKNRAPQFISSYGFAGNSLYLDGSLNTLDAQGMRDSLLYRYISEQEIFRQQAANARLQRISRREHISTLMNYGFTKDPDNFHRIFNNEGAKFMLLLHNAALIYHVAQLCKVESPDEAPVTVYLTGNGSKLFEMNGSYRTMIKDIFKHVYDDAVPSDDIEQIQIRRPHDPKAATAIGALKGFSKTDKYKLATNEDSAANHIIMVGDNHTTSELRQGVARLEGYDFEQVKSNVENFIEMFYEIVYTSFTPIIDRETCLKTVDFVQNDGRLRVRNGSLISDSLFFQYIALVMQRLSVNMGKEV